MTSWRTITSRGGAAADQIGRAALREAQVRRPGQLGPPTFVDTPMFQSSLQRAREPERIRTALLWQVPLGRPAQPREIADLMVYLLSDESAFVTLPAPEMVIDGGLTAQ